MTYVLLFHGVTTNRQPSHFLHNYNNKHIHKDKFARLLRDLSQSHDFFSIDQLCDSWLCGEGLPERSCIITFDDGFLNNHRVAAPILADLDIPAVFYVSTGNITSRSTFWVDELEIAFIKGQEQGSRIEVSVDTQRNADIIDLKNLDSQELISKLEMLKSRLKLVSPHTRTHHIANILKQVHLSRPIDSSAISNDYDVMCWSHLREMAAHPLFTVGGHSVDHNIFSTMTIKEQESEIVRSISTLQQELGSFSGHYAYPEGQLEHFGSETEILLRRYGVKCCPSAIHGIAQSANQTLFNLRRLMIGMNAKADDLLYKIML